MLKITGAILLLAGSTGIGFSIFMEMKQRLCHIRSLHHMFTLLESEIGYVRATMEEACLALCPKFAQPYRGFLEQICKEMADNRGSSFASLWKKAVREQLAGLPLKESDWEILEKFADYTGHMDLTLQRKLIAYEIEDFSRLAAQIEKEIAGKGRLCLTFGVMGGLFLTVVFL